MTFNKKEYDKQWKNKNKEKVKIIRKRYQKKNQERLSQQRKEEYNNLTIEQKEKLRTYQKEYKKQNPKPSIIRYCSCGVVLSKNKKYCSECRDKREKERKIKGDRRYEQSPQRRTYLRNYRKIQRCDPNHKHRMRIRKLTAYKYPITDKTICSLCGNNEDIQRHHTTEPYEVDKFIFICRGCHDKIHNKTIGLYSNLPK